LYFSEIKTNEIIEEAKTSVNTDVLINKNENKIKQDIVSEKNLTSQISNLTSTKPKRELPKSSTLGSMFKEIHTEVVIEVDHNKVDLTSDNIQSIWKEFLEENKATLQNAFMSVAINQTPELIEDKIVFVLTNNISSELLQLHKMDITSYFRKRTTSTIVVPEFVMKKSENQQKNYKTTKDRLKDMIDANNAVLKLIEKFELNLD
jgi:hypothetical protein